jgi:ferric iron reductase protein FhuF
LSVSSELAIRLLTRGVWNTAGALYRIDTVWRMIGKDEEIDQMEALVAAYLEGATREIDGERERLSALMEQHGIEELPEYTQAQEINVRILSPFIASYIALILKVDDLMKRLDALWLNGLVTSLERKQRLIYWIAELRDLRTRIRAVERKTRELALRLGKEKALETGDENIVESPQAEAAA